MDAGVSKSQEDSFCVWLSASQTRKRLKGHGFGVRRVEAFDRKQAKVVHTATGEHRRELRRLFADVLIPDDTPTETS